MKLERIFVSQHHAYFGRHGRGAAAHPIQELQEVECISGFGLRGDRFFGYRENYRGQVTLFAREVFEQLRRELALPNAEPSATRRNLFVSGADLNALIGAEFELQGVRLLGTEECRPCYWMDEALGPGAEVWLKHRGGLRCRVLTSGWLRRETPGR